MKRWIKWSLRGALLVFGLYLLWQFWPLETISDLPELKIAVWMSVTWSMDAHSDEELQALAAELKARNVSDAYVYLSYLRAGDSFNPSFDEAANFLNRMRLYAPELRWFAWLGVPIAITQPNGVYEANRMERPEIRAQLSDFALFTIRDLGFDGFHLNAELIPSEDTAFLATLESIRASLPAEAIFSTTAHALRPMRWITSIPYPHAERVEQIALMAYDSALPFPRDYRNWMTYQTQEAALALDNMETELLIGLPVSEEWTLTHQTQSESLSNALLGLQDGWSSRINGIALCPHWEISVAEWDLLDD